MAKDYDRQGAVHLGRGECLLAHRGPLAHSDVAGTLLSRDHSFCRCVMDRAVSSQGWMTPT